MSIYANKKLKQLVLVPQEVSNNFIAPITLTQMVAKQCNKYLRQINQAKG